MKGAIRGAPGSAGLVLAVLASVAGSSAPAAQDAAGSVAEAASARVLAALARTYDGRLFCAPRATSQADLGAAVAAFSHAHPELGGMLNDEQTLRGLAERYPCDASTLSPRGPDARLRRAFEDITAPVRTIAPVFSQLLSIAFPAGFAAAPVYQSAPGTSPYLRQYVPDGESVDEWSEMISVTAVKGMADQSAVTLAQYVAGVAGGYRLACPESYVGSGVDVDFVRGFETVAVIVSCGESPLTHGRHSESAMIVAIKGRHDYYSLQWSQRGEPWSTPLPIDQRRWLDKFARLAPIRLCPLLPGEAVPYPSCFSAPAQ